MAALTTHILLHCSTLPSTPRFLSLPKRGAALNLGDAHKTMALDFGGSSRGDPFPAEIEGKGLGPVDSDHLKLVPNISALALSQQQCSPLSPSHPPLSIDDAQALLFKLVGWRLLDEEEGLKLQCLWKLRDFQCGVELINRISKLGEEAGHFPSLHLEPPNHVIAQLWTPSIGGLSMNDFILASKIDELKTSDLLPRRRAWA